MRVERRRSRAELSVRMLIKRGAKGYYDSTRGDGEPARYAWRHAHETPNTQVFRVPVDHSHGEHRVVREECARPAPLAAVGDRRVVPAGRHGEPNVLLRVGPDLVGGREVAEDRGVPLALERRGPPCGCRYKVSVSKDDFIACFTLELLGLPNGIMGTVRALGRLVQEHLARLESHAVVGDKEARRGS